MYRCVQYMLLKRILLAVTGMLLFACISRDNYWDPMNYSQIFGRNVRDSATARIDSGFHKLPLNLLDTIQAKVSAVKASDSIIQLSNILQKGRNNDTLEFNKVADSANQNLQSSFSDFTRKRLLDTFSFLIVPRDTLSTILQSLKSSVSLEKQRAEVVLLLCAILLFVGGQLAISSLGTSTVQSNGHPDNRGIASGDRCSHSCGFADTCSSNRNPSARAGQSDRENGECPQWSQHEE